MLFLGDTSILCSSETTIASAATTDLGTSLNRYIAITGTTTITSFGTGKNKELFLRFTGALTLTYNATSLILPGAANINTLAGDTAIATSDSSGNWTVREYNRNTDTQGVWTAYTPTIAVQNGSYTSANATGRYSRIGKTVNFNITLNIVTVGTGSGYTNLSLPFTSNSNFVVMGREVLLTGKLVYGQSLAGPLLTVSTFDGTAYAGNGAAVVISGSYEAV